MRTLLPLFLLTGLAGCPKKPDNFDADAKSGPDGRRTGAKAIMVNTPITDEVNYKNQDKTDWYALQLVGKPGILTTKVNWDNGGSDLQIDVFDEFGKQISASPARTGTAKDKTLLTQIDRVGQYFVRITAPNPGDGSVYTMEAKWELPKAEVPVTLIQPEPDAPPPEPKPKKHREPVEKPEKPSGDTLQGRIVQAYRDGDAMVLQIDKGSANGIKSGMTGAVLSGMSGEDPVDGGDFKIYQVVAPNKSLARSPLRSLGKNNRVMINLGK
jgi:hypothetical protein